ncbi:hypothetical protein AURDEDRAFT_173530 [Auricularia subglabra TFB-10046 SS5]|nr:hypothetical protein AURDEDRAFT_173530 [Auricularia subglabra TFB-10046 SS5]
MAPRQDTLSEQRTDAGMWPSAPSRRGARSGARDTTIHAPRPRRAAAKVGLFENEGGDDDLKQDSDDEPEVPDFSDWQKILPQGMNVAEYFLYSPPASPEPETYEPYEPDKFITNPDPIEDPVELWQSDSHLWYFVSCNNLDVNMRKYRQYMRRLTVVRARYELGLPLTVPRPKIPVEQSFWDWLGIKLELKIEPDAEICRGVGLDWDMPKQLDFETPREFMVALGVWYVRAQHWTRARENELARVKLQIAVDETSDRRGLMNREIAKVVKPVRDVLETIVPQRLAREVYAADRTAPRLLRHFLWWVYTMLPAPEGYGDRYSIIIHCNVDFIWPIPPSKFKVLRIDGRYGIQEESRFPQWHVMGRWHMAFILTEEYGRIAELCEHEQLFPAHAGAPLPAMEFYRINLGAHFITHDDQTYTPNGDLRRAMEAWWTHVEQAARSAMYFLFTYALPRRHLIHVMASWQRGVAEMRGFINYARSVVSLERRMAKSKRKVPVTADLRIRPFRKPVRGVITDDRAVAAVYAQHGVPVMLVEGSSSRYWRAEPTTDHVDVSAPFVCETRAYENSNKDWQQPVYLAARQEYWSPAVTARADVLIYQDGEHRPSNTVPPRRTLAPIEERRHDDARDDHGDSYGDDDYNMHQGDDYHEAEYPTTISASTSTNAGPAATSSASTTSQKRKADEPASSGERKKNKTKNRPATLKLAQGAKSKRLDEYPAWWPKEWEVACIAVKSNVIVDGPYMRKVQQDPVYPVPVGKGFTATFASPVLEHFAGSPIELNRSRLYVSYVMLRPKLLFALDTETVRAVQRFSAGVWKRVLSHHVPVEQQLQVANRFGFALAPPPRIVEVDDSSPSFESLVEALSSDTMSAIPSTRAASPSSSQSQAPPSTAPTTRPASPVNDEDVDMTRIPRNAGSPPVKQPELYFVPVDVPCQPPLELEEARYKKEPSGFRATGKGKPRAKTDFIWFVEEDSPTKEDGVLEFLEASAKTASKYIEEEQDSDVWWDYEHHWIFVFNSEPSSRKGRLSGERVTQPLRLFQWAGSHSRAKYVHGTQQGPRQIRLWHAQRLDKPVYVPDAPIGPVGCQATPHGRDVEQKWYLPDDDYKFLFPNAPRRVAPPQIVIEDERRTRKSTSSRSAPTAEGPTSAPAPMSDAMDVDGPPVSAPTEAPSAPAASRLEDASARPKIPRPLEQVLCGQRDMFFKGMPLTPYDPDTTDPSYSWPTDAERTAITWDISELSFRLQLLELDDRLRTLYPTDTKLTAQSNLERQRMICSIWQSETFVPQGPSALPISEWMLRIDSVEAFYCLVSTWPRVNIPEPPEAWQSQEDFIKFEKEVWSAYARVHADYLYREAPVPMETPEISEFFSLTLNKTPEQVARLLELSTIHGLGSLANKMPKNAGETRMDTRMRIQQGLDKIITLRYPNEDAPHVQMNYESYDYDIVFKHRVRLVGWTFNNGRFLNPGKLPMDDVRALHDGLVKKSVYWELVPESEVVTAEKRKRPQRSDAGEKRTKKKTRTATAAGGAAAGAAKPRKGVRSKSVVSEHSSSSPSPSQSDAE